MNLFNSSVSTISLVVAAIGVWFVYKQLKLNHDTHQFDVFMQLREKFSSQEMNHALYSLMSYYNRFESEDAFLESWISGFTKKEKLEVDLNHYRRLVRAFVATLEVSVDQKSLNIHLSSRVVTRQFIFIYDNIVDPMHKKLYGNDINKSNSIFLKKISDHF